jgi:hypothetical protein
MSELLESTPSELFVLKRCIELRCPLCDGCENGVIDAKFGTYWMRCIRVDGTTFVLHYAPIRTQRAASWIFVLLYSTSPKHIS